MSEEKDEGVHAEAEGLLASRLLGEPLDAASAARLETHLAGCARCRAEAEDLAPLAAALRQVDPDDVRPVGIAPPPALDARIDEALGGGRGAPPRAGRRWLAPVGGLLVGAAAASLLVLTTRPDVPRAPQARPAAPVVSITDVRSSGGVDASAGYVDHTWGVEIKLEATGLPSGREYRVGVVDSRGRLHEAGEFRGVEPTRRIDCDLNASVLRADAARFVVTGPSGRTWIEGDLRS